MAGVSIAPAFYFASSYPLVSTRSKNVGIALSSLNRKADITE